MKSKLITAVFADELERTERLIARYEKEISEYPKGSIFRRKIGNGEYLYLNYREGKKVVSKFLGKAETFNTSELESQLARRKELFALLKKLRQDKSALEKELKK